MTSALVVRNSPQGNGSYQNSPLGQIIDWHVYIREEETEWGRGASPPNTNTTGIATCRWSCGYTDQQYKRAPVHTSCFNVRERDVDAGRPLNCPPYLGTSICRTYISAWPWRMTELVLQYIHQGMIKHIQSGFDHSLPTEKTNSGLKPLEIKSE